MRKRITWAKGEKAELARRCNISQQYLTDILRGRKQSRASALAAVIAAQAQEMGLALSRLDVLYPDESISPLLEG